MKREVMEREFAKLIAYIEAKQQIDYFFGSLDDLKNRILEDEFCFSDVYKNFDKNAPEYSLQVSKEYYEKLPEEDRAGMSWINCEEKFYMYNPEYSKARNVAFNQFKNEFNEKHNFKTESDWANYFYESTGHLWFSSEEEYAQYLLDCDYFCDLSDEELIEQYNYYKKAR